ncbi:MAG: DUF4422 domain-containing protein [Candidatus Margulisbacteria bacterium]|jgi:hypothetical protein|nr:DUF4422 domain-containing protein [Candidatus Margulisiibacteriota bacterium]
MSDNKIKILVCTHKQTEFPPDDIFLPIHCGKALSNVDLGIQGDDTGDNISAKNETFAELTGLYWAWKNLKKLYPDVEYVGLCHYRRYFALRPLWKTIPYGWIAAKTLPMAQNYGATFQRILKHKQVILAQRKVLSCNTFTFYASEMHSRDYHTLRQIIHELQPDYEEAFLTVWEGSNKHSPYNMFICRRDWLDEYCKWLFPILYEAERRIKTDNYDEHSKRVFAMLSEHLLNVYVHQHGFNVKYLPIFFLDNKDGRILFFKNLFSVMIKTLAFWLQMPTVFLFSSKYYARKRKSVYENN